MAKIYNTAKLQVVHLSHNDIVTYSPTVGTNATNEMEMEAPDRRGFYDWDAGY